MASKGGASGGGRSRARLLSGTQIETQARRLLPNADIMTNPLFPNQRRVITTDIRQVVSGTRSEVRQQLTEIRDRQAALFAERRASLNAISSQQRIIDRQSALVNQDMLNEAARRNNVRRQR